MWYSYIYIYVCIDICVVYTNVIGLQGMYTLSLSLSLSLSLYFSAKRYAFLDGLAGLREA